MEVTSMEVNLISRCTSQGFPHTTEEYLNMYTCLDFSLNPLTLGFDSLHCPSCHSFWDVTFKIVIHYLYEEFLVPPVSMLSLKHSTVFLWVPLPHFILVCLVANNFVFLILDNYLPSQLSLHVFLGLGFLKLHHSNLC